MLQIVPAKPCCGPFAQKLKRLGDLDRAIDELRKEAAAPGLLETVLNTKKIVQNWLAAHRCARTRPKGLAS
jgi:hypothetical protein